MTKVIISELHHANHWDGSSIRVLTIDRPDGDRWVELQEFAPDGFMVDRRYYRHRHRELPIAFNCVLANGLDYMFHEHVQALVNAHVAAQNSGHCTSHVSARFSDNGDVVLTPCPDASASACNFGATS